MLRLSKRTIYFSITPPVTEYAERRRVCLAAESVPSCLRAEVSLPRAVPFDAVFFLSPETGCGGNPMAQAFL